MTTKNNLLTLFLLLSTFFVSKLSNALSNSHLTGTPPNHHHHHHHAPASEQPLAKIAIHKAVNALQESACITANPLLMGCQGEDTEWVNVEVKTSEPSESDWVGVFSPANFNSSDCYSESTNELQDNGPYICTAPIKYMFANHSNHDYTTTGKASLTFQIINQRADFSFALFSGGLQSPKLISASSPISFANPKAPLYPRLAQGKTWDEMSVTWTSGYNIDEATPFVEWGWEDQSQTKKLSPAGTLTFSRSSMCGEPARTVGWRDPGFIHTSFLKDLWPNTMYTYRMGHKLTNGSFIWSKLYSFNSSPYPGQDSLQRVVIFGDMGKAERDGSNEYDNYQPGSLITANQLTNELDDYDIVFHIGNLAFAKGYISQWDQFTAQIEPIASKKPYMVASGNNERDFPNSGSFYLSSDSGGECGVPAETMFYVPADNRAKFWYATDYGMFHFCIADSEHDWREGSEQYAWLEKCFASVDRQKQPWLIFAANRVLGYSSSSQYAIEGSLGEPMGREHLQKLWQKYKVDIAFYGHIHSYERTCPVYQDQCVNTEKYNYSGTVDGTIHVVVGGGGSELSTFAYVDTEWSLYKDHDWGFVKLTAFNHSSLLFEYKKSSDGLVYDSFTISRDYKDVLACVHDGCGTSTLAP
ncbi:probable inactive purple acid phosphatase 27 [Lactuca sativa]|uniref:probable inactive purple acid phosphatase 27 n=1 Tax=Lactuca sativa TaxID=4236 RepID=UPI0022AFBC2C|nr:probable inactive purple acid phosphatase 27 [Lactuca sativa]